MHGTSEPSPWVTRWAGAAADGAGRRALDLACGSGRHLRWLSQRGWHVTGVDRDAAAVEPLRTLGEIVVADLESGPWPLAGRRFDLVVVTHYLWRPTLPALLDLVDVDGWLVYETFAVGHETIGRPSNPDFLLRPGELLAVAASGGLQVIGFEDGYVSSPERFVQRLAAVRPGASEPGRPPRRRLDGDAGGRA
jgi:SAM-dependent methyltransferase